MEINFIKIILWDRYKLGMVNLIESRFHNFLHHNHYIPCPL